MPIPMWLLLLITLQWQWCTCPWLYQILHRGLGHRQPQVRLSDYVWCIILYTLFSLWLALQYQRHGRSSTSGTSDRKCCITDMCFIYIYMYYINNILYIKDRIHSFTHGQIFSFSLSLSFSCCSVLAAFWTWGRFNEHAGQTWRRLARTSHVILSANLQSGKTRARETQTEPVSLHNT